MQCGANLVLKREIHQELRGHALMKNASMNSQSMSISGS